MNFPSGSFWAITISSVLWGAFIDLGNVPNFPAEVLAAGPYNFTISPPAGYTVFPDAGSVNLTGNLTIHVSFSKVGVPGNLYITLAPAAGARLWVDGDLVANASVGRVNLSLPAGIHSVYATSPGYLPYFNNVSIEGGGSTSLLIAFTLEPSAQAGSSNGTAAFLPWLVAGVCAAVAVGLAAALGYVYSRPRPPGGPGDGPARHDPEALTGPVTSKRTSGRPRRPPPGSRSPRPACGAAPRRRGRGGTPRSCRRSFAAAARS